MLAMRCDHEDHIFFGGSLREGKPTCKNEGWEIHKLAHFGQQRHSQHFANMSQHWGLFFFGGGGWGKGFLLFFFLLVHMLPQLRDLLNWLQDGDISIGVFKIQHLTPCTQEQLKAYFYLRDGRFTTRKIDSHALGQWHNCRPIVFVASGWAWGDHFFFFYPRLALRDEPSTTRKNWLTLLAKYTHNIFGQHVAILRDARLACLGLLGGSKAGDGRS